jgi:hypothetical protein
MAKYIMVYRGPATPIEDITPEQGEAIMAEWNNWIGKVGTALLDVGSPFGPRGAVLGDGTDGTPADLNGYSIVEADSLDAAKGLCDHHPFLSTGTSDFSVDVYELMPM